MECQAGRQRLAWESSENEDDIGTVIGRRSERTRRSLAETVTISFFFESNPKLTAPSSQHRLFNLFGTERLCSRWICDFRETGSGRSMVIRHCCSLKLPTSVFLHRFPMPDILDRWAPNPSLVVKQEKEKRNIQSQSTQDLSPLADLDYYSRHVFRDDKQHCSNLIIPLLSYLQRARRINYDADLIFFPLQSAGELYLLPFIREFLHCRFPPHNPLVVTLCDSPLSIWWASGEESVCTSLTPTIGERLPIWRPWHQHLSEYLLIIQLISAAFIAPPAGLKHLQL